jgi:hypothetical protein
MLIYLKEASVPNLVHCLFKIYSLLVKLCSTPYTPLEKKIVDNTDDETVTEEWTLDQPVSQTRTTAIIEVKGTVDIVLTPLVAEALDRY